MRILRAESIAKFIAGSSITAVLAIALAFFTWTQPVADDFCRGVVDVGPLDYARINYLEHSGRWAALALDAAVLPRLPLTSPWYPLATLLLFTLWALALHILVRTTLDMADGGRHWHWTAGLIAILWAGLPSTGQTVYWLTGAVEYLLAASSCLLTIVMLSWSTRLSSTPRARAGWLFAAILLAILTTGLHEITGAFLTVLIAAGIALHWRSDVTVRAQWCAVGVVCAVGLAVTVLAPGNTVRMADAAADTMGLVDHMGPAGIVSWQISELLLPWLVDAKLVALTIILLASGRAIRFAPLIARPEQVAAWRILAPAATLACLGGGLLAPIVLLGNAGPGRLHSLLYEAIVIGWSCTVFAWTFGRRPMGEMADRRFRIFGYCLLSVGLAASPNVSSLPSNLFGARSVIPWAANLRHEYARARAAAGQNLSLHFGPRRPEPTVYFKDEGLRPNPDDWRNRCYAEYFDVASVTAGDVGQ
jgi:hypothetical protein